MLDSIAFLTSQRRMRAQFRTPSPHAAAFRHRWMARFAAALRGAADRFDPEAETWISN